MNTAKKDLAQLTLILIEHLEGDAMILEQFTEKVVNNIIMLLYILITLQDL